jgi:hypothetical protein
MAMPLAICTLSVIPPILSPHDHWMTRQSVRSVDSTQGRIGAGQLGTDNPEQKAQKDSLV